VKSVDVIEPPVPRFGDYRQAPPVSGGVGCAVFDSPGNDSVTSDTDAMRVRNHDWSFQKPAFVEPRGASHFAVAIQAEIAGVNRVVERIVSTRNDCGYAGAHRAFANFQFSVATDQGRVTDLHTRDIRDRVQFPRHAIERHTEISRANNFDLGELLYRRR
jgi:hypothetical protein